MTPVLAATVVALVAGAASLPALGPRERSYPVFYLSPRYGPPHLTERVAIIPTPEDPRAPPIITNRVTMAADPDSQEDDYEVSQFHTQDTRGRFVFGFHSPDQVRMEARNHDGSVRGSYSYIDPNGNIVKMQYWDDGNGFHAIGNNLPRSFYEPPQYTPEVQAARDEHFRLYQHALRIADATTSLQSQENDDVDTSEQNDSNFDSNEESQEDTVVVGEGVEEAVQAEQDYPKYQAPPGLLTPNHVLDTDRESVSLDNPELRSAVLSRFWNRRGKSQDVASLEPKPVKEEVDDTPAENVNVEGSEEAAAKVAGAEDGGGAEPKERGPYYHFEKLIPVEVKEEATREDSVSLRATQAGSVPVAAVHDVQVSPAQRDSLKNHQILPVYVTDE